MKDEESAENELDGAALRELAHVILGGAQMFASEMVYLPSSFTENKDVGRQSGWLDLAAAVVWAMGLAFLVLDGG